MPERITTLDCAKTLEILLEPERPRVSFILITVRHSDDPKMNQIETATNLEIDAAINILTLVKLEGSNAS